jgi:hypothetical protein
VWLDEILCGDDRMCDLGPLQLPNLLSHLGSSYNINTAINVLSLLLFLKDACFAERRGNDRMCGEMIFCVEMIECVER